MNLRESYIERVKENNGIPSRGAPMPNGLMPAGAQATAPESVRGAMAHGGSGGEARLEGLISPSLAPGRSMRNIMSALHDVKQTIHYQSFIYPCRLGKIANAHYRGVRRIQVNSIGLVRQNHKACTLFPRRARQLFSAPDLGCLDFRIRLLEANRWSVGGRSSNSECAVGMSVR